VTKVLVDGEPAWIVDEWSDFTDSGFDLLMVSDGSKRWISISGARVRITAYPNNKNPK
jgi:hypothetical protein